MHRQVSLSDRRTDRRIDPVSVLTSVLTHLLSLALWTHYFPVRTAERIFHIMFPDTKDHKVRLNYANDQDEALFRHMTFGLRDPHQTSTEDEDFASYPPSLIIAVQPPWVLAPQDLESFVNNRKVVMRLGYLAWHSRLISRSFLLLTWITQTVRSVPKSFFGQKFV